MLFFLWKNEWKEKKRKVETHLSNYPTVINFLDLLHAYETIHEVKFVLFSTQTNLSRKKNKKQIQVEWHKGAAYKNKKSDEYLQIVRLKLDALSTPKEEHLQENRKLF